MLLPRVEGESWGRAIPSQRIPSPGAPQPTSRTTNPAARRTISHPAPKPNRGKALAGTARSATAATQTRAGEGQVPPARLYAGRRPTAMGDTGRNAGRKRAALERAAQRGVRLWRAS